jgi:hypothetical protein
LILDVYQIREATRAQAGDNRSRRASSPGKKITHSHTRPKPIPPRPYQRTPRERYDNT